METKDLVIMDKGTGEMLPISLNSKQIKEIVANMPEPKMADYLQKSNYIRKTTEKVEKAIKDKVKSKFDINAISEDGEQWFDYVIKRVAKFSFDKDKFEKEATKQEKNIIEKAEAIKSKYQINKPYIKF